MLAHLASTGECAKRAASESNGTLASDGLHPMTVYLWVTCILASLNALTNGFSLVVFTLDKKNMSMRRLLVLLSLSETVLNICMSVNLSVILSVGSERHKFSGLAAPNLVTGAFFLSFVLFNAYIMIRNWCLVLIAGSRCEVVRDPLSTRSGQVFSPRRSLGGYIVLSLLSLGVYTPRMFEFTWTVYRLPCEANFSNDSTAALADPAEYLLTTHVHHILDSLPAYGYYKTMVLFPLQTILPIVLIGVLSFLIVFTLRRRRFQQQQLRQPQSVRDPTAARSSQDAATKTVIVLMATFITCELPTFVFFVLNRTVFCNLANYPVVRMHTTFVGNILVCLDSFSNFIIYSSTSNSFRQTVRRILHLPAAGKQQQPRHQYQRQNTEHTQSNSYIALRTCESAKHSRSSARSREHSLTALPSSAV